jgi:hypothetical protein
MRHVHSISRQRPVAAQNLDSIVTKLLRQVPGFSQLQALIALSNAAEKLFDAFAD